VHFFFFFLVGCGERDCERIEPSEKLLLTSDLHVPEIPIPENGAFTCLAAVLRGSKFKVVQGGKKSNQTKEFAGF
jgi:hypothetical protein